MKHYPALIRQYGAPNGLCSSITESKHIKAVKQPYRRTNRHNALGQMLVCNQRLDKLVAIHTDFKEQGMLKGTCLSVLEDVLVQANSENQQPEATMCPEASGSGPTPQSPALASSDSAGYVEDIGGEAIDDPTAIEAHVELARTPQRKRARTVRELGEELDIDPDDLDHLLQHFLYHQENMDDMRDLADIPLDECPSYGGKISVYNSAVATFYAPSDISGVNGMRREYIRSCPSWRQAYPRHDCTFVTTDSDLKGMEGLDVVRILAFFSFTLHGERFPCAVVHWFVRSDGPDPDTGMWIAQPGFNTHHQRNISIIHIDSIYRAAHLIPIYGTQSIPSEPLIQPHHSYDIFRAFYINKFADHHAFEIAS
ncbi:hypothetical protein L210DRAFT_3643262 [Boletus edulis BED1]|uniref:Uncharacterized protein n=1 Tax=Boletus edulis BED1 TaxID=1328754 RepID=A0AAD4GH61_BOLED|nr:hypothetical protein L210DRAFT_3643262 [Boletus edulis BED1]